MNKFSKKIIEISYINEKFNLSNLICKFSNLEIPILLKDMDLIYYFIFIYHSTYL